MIDKTRYEKYEAIILALFLFTAFCIIYWPFIRENIGFLGQSDVAFESLPNIRYLAEVLKNINIPLWSFSIGLGDSFDNSYIGDVSKLIISVIAAFCNNKAIPLIILWVQAGKIILSGLFFRSFLKELSFHSFPCFLGGVLYALCGISIISGVRLHYATEVTLLAFLLYSLEKYFQKNRAFSLIFAIVFLFIYKGLYPVYLYSVLLFFYAIFRYYIWGSQYSFKEYIMRCALIWLFAIGLSGIIIIPNILETMKSSRFHNTYSDSSKLLELVRLASPERLIAVFESFFSPSMNGAWNSSLYIGDGLDGPEFYCGICVVYLFPHFIMHVKGKLKNIILCTLSIILLYIICPVVTYIFNLGISSYYFKLSSLWIVSFLVTGSMYAFNQLIKGHWRTKKYFLIAWAFVLSGVLIYLAFCNPQSSPIMNRYSFIIALFFIIVWLAIFLSYSPKHKWSCFIIGFVLCSEALLSPCHATHGKQFIYAKAVLNKMKNNIAYKNFSEAIDYMNFEKSDNYFYRIGKDFQISQKMFGETYLYPIDPVLFHYNGLEYHDSFVSSQTTFYNKMGISQVGSHSFEFPPERQVLASFLDTQFWIAEHNLPDNYDEIMAYEEMVVGKNRYNLPLAFTYSNTMQTDFFESLNNHDKDIALYYAYIPSSENDSKNETEITKNTYGNFYKIRTDFSSLSWSRDCSQIDFLSKNSMYMTMHGNNAVAVFTMPVTLGREFSFKISNSTEGKMAVLFYDGTQWQKRFIKVSGTPTQINIKLPNCKVEAIAFASSPSVANNGRETCLIEDITFEYVDYDEYNRLWKEGYDERMQETFNITSLEQNSIVGDITVSGDKMLFFSIPYDEGWTVKIDGKKVKKECINYGFIGVPVHDGYHTIELNYFMPGMKLGMAGSIMACIILVVLKKRNICL